MTSHEPPSAFVKPRRAPEFPTVAMNALTWAMVFAIMGTCLHLAALWPSRLSRLLPQQSSLVEALAHGANVVSYVLTLIGVIVLVRAVVRGGAHRISEQPTPPIAAP